FIVFLLFYFSRPHLHLLSFPTRRSSDLVPEREDLVHLLLVLGDDDHALRVVPDVGELPGDRVLVDGDRDAAERLRGELGPVQARPVVADHREALAAGEAERGETEREVPDLAV